MNAAAQHLPDPTPAQLAARQTAMDNKRKTYVKALKAAQRQAGIDDESYRAGLALVTGGKLGADGITVVGGKRSATELTLLELERAIEAIRRKGAPHPTRSGGQRRPTTAEDRADLMAKIHKLLEELGRVTKQTYSLKYADAIAKRNGWATCVDFCDPPALHRVVGALSRTLRKKQAEASA